MWAWLAQLPHIPRAQRGEARVHSHANKRPGPSMMLAAVLVSAPRPFPPAALTAIQRRPPSPSPGRHREAARAASARLRRPALRMFLHFGILTYTGAWAKPNLDIEQFNPTRLIPGQWADAAVAARMKYAVLTTRHHDGFAYGPARRATSTSGTSPGAAARETSCASTSTPSAAAACCPASTIQSGIPPRRSAPGTSRPPSWRTSRRSSPSC